MKSASQLTLVLCVVLGLYLGPSYAGNLNGPYNGNFFAATVDSENIKLTGVQVTETGCEKTSVTISGQITGTTDDGYGYDEVGFELWDDGEVKDSENLKVKVGETMNFKVTLSFESLYGTSVPGVGVYIYDLPERTEIYRNDPFIPENISGSCLDTYTLSVSLTGDGEVKSTPAGIDCGDDCSENFQEGTEVTLKATPHPGFVFKGWKGSSCDGLASDTCVVKMTSAQDITAIFEEGDSCSGSYNEGFEAGKEWCRQHPEECGIGGSGTCDYAATFDFITNTLHIPNFQNTYELDFSLVGTDPVTLQLKSYKPLH